MQSDPTGSGTYSSTEIVENFPLSGNYTVDAAASDANGNLSFDGVYGYTYDAWNGLMTVSRAYNSGGTVYSGTAFDTMAYDARGRRISKALIGTAEREKR